MGLFREVVRWLGLRVAGTLWAGVLRVALAGALCIALLAMISVGFGLTGAAMRGEMWEGYAVGWWGSVITAAVVYGWHRHRVKGFLGEFFVRITLRVWLASGKRYYDAYLPLDERVVQIDHIVVCARGVFVIETKNWSGRIQGWPDDGHWTVQTRRARIGHSAINPVRQNDEHVQAVAVALGETVPIMSIVALVGWGRLVEGHAPSVTHGLSGLVCGIMERKEMISAPEVKTLAERLESALLPRDAETRARHEHTVSRARRARR